MHLLQEHGSRREKLFNMTAVIILVMPLIICKYGSL